MAGASRIQSRALVGFYRNGGIDSIKGINYNVRFATTVAKGLEGELNLL